MTNYTPDQLKFINSICSSGKSRQRKIPPCGEDLSINSYINKYGGIESPVDSKVYRTKQSYLDHLKANNCHIKGEG